jgi:hypothetical protein
MHLASYPLKVLLTSQLSLLCCTEMQMEKDTVDAGICAMAACEHNKVLIFADNWGEVYVYDISGTLESAKYELISLFSRLSSLRGW